MGVVKNIIPAIASTNALVSAACVNEAFKLVTGANHHMNNYMMYMGQTGVHCHTFDYQREKDCFVCQKIRLKEKVAPTVLLKDFIESLKEKYRLANPALRD